MLRMPPHSAPYIATFERTEKECYRKRDLSHPAFCSSVSVQRIITSRDPKMFSSSEGRLSEEKGTPERKGRELQDPYAWHTPGDVAPEMPESPYMR